MDSQFSKTELRVLRRWNWGAFFLGPIWAFANRLELWGILYFVPPITIFAFIYLPLRGNELAVRRSPLSVIDFARLQRVWGQWGLRFFLVTWIIIPIIFSIWNLIMH
jgi:hypothetical protein